MYALTADQRPHRPALVRTAVLAAGVSLVFMIVFGGFAPALADVSGTVTVGILAFVLGQLIRIGAGYLGGQVCRNAGVLPRAARITAVAGGLVGWLCYPGVLVIIGLAMEPSLLGLVRVVAELLLWAGMCAFGAALAYRQ